MKKMFRVCIMTRKSKNGNSFPVYRAKTLKDAWFDLVFGKKANKINKSCVIEIEEENFSMGYKQDKENNYIMDKNGNKIPQIFIMGEYNMIKDEDAPKELQAKKVYDTFKDMF